MVQFVRVKVLLSCWEWVLAAWETGYAPSPNGVPPLSLWHHRQPMRVWGQKLVQGSVYSVHVIPQDCHIGPRSILLAILPAILPTILLNQQYCWQDCQQYCWQYCQQNCWFRNIAEKYCWQYCWLFSNIADNIAG